MGRRLMLMALCAALAACTLAPPAVKETTGAPVQTRATPDQIAMAEAAFARFPSSGQYMRQSCQATTLPGWTGLPLQRCRYTELGVTTEVTALFPDTNRLALWAVNACLDAAAPDLPVCIDRVSRRIWASSNAQFAVSGFVVEPASAIGLPGDAPYCMLFRDGVTIATASVDTRPASGGSCGPFTAEAEPVTKVKRFARIAGTSREELARVPGAPDLDALQGTAFLDAVRADVLSAWTTGKSRLIAAAALTEVAR